MGLQDDFSSFLNSPESKKPAIPVREDWREWQYEQAVLNGDLHADENPDISLGNSWSEPDFDDEPTAEELEELEAPPKFKKAGRSEIDES